MLRVSCGTSRTSKHYDLQSAGASSFKTRRLHCPISSSTHKALANMGGLAYGSYGAGTALVIIGLCMSLGSLGNWIAAANYTARYALPRRGRSFRCSTPTLHDPLPREVLTHTTRQVGAFIESISPYTWASTGIGLCIGLSVVGAAWSVKSILDTHT